VGKAHGRWTKYDEQAGWLPERRRATFEEDALAGLWEVSEKLVGIAKPSVVAA
jgi:hypothetical protein